MSPTDPPGAGYSGTPLARKLGVKTEARVLIIGAPDGFAIPDLPAGVIMHSRAGTGPYEVALLFVSRHAELASRFTTVAGRLTVDGSLWVCWPKKAAVKAGLAVTDLDENQVRDHGLTAGLVDTKIAAVDQVWSALRFVRRLADRPAARRAAGR
jgi:hypothetical protein